MILLLTPSVIAPLPKIEELGLVNMGATVVFFIIALVFQRHNLPQVNISKQLVRGRLSSAERYSSL